MFSTTETKEERCLDCLPQIPERNYRPHAFETRLHRRGRARESGWPIRKILQYYHVRGPSLYRWLRRYGESGEAGPLGLPHRPKSPHPASIPAKAAYKIKCLFDKSKSNGMPSAEIWVKAMEHGSKAERSRRIGREKSCRTLLFHFLKDLREQGARWARGYNETLRMTLRLRSPNQIELELLGALMDTTGEIRCPKLLKRLKSIDS